MQYSLDSMKVALRVLTALTEKRAADEKDIAELRALAGPSSEGLPPDELACEVIQLALRHRAQVRGVGR